jgi:hypothetical protein
LLRVLGEPLPLVILVALFSRFRVMATDLRRNKNCGVLQRHPLRSCEQEKQPSGINALFT